jgi:hypothetical protein
MWMREHDDHIRLYTPVLQRIIVLLAVIVAVPVVLWTITAFVRAYVGPPKVPTFQRMSTAMVTPADTAAPMSDATPAPASTGALAPSEARTTGTDTRVPLLTIRKPPDLDQTQTAAPAPASAPVTPQVAITPSITAATGNSQQPAAPVVTAPPMPQAATAPAATTPPPGAPQNFADRSDRVSAPAQSGQSLAWPNPPPLPPPAADTGASAGTAMAAQEPAAADDTAQTDALSPAPPIRGPIPLPRRRPTVFAMAQPGSAGVPMPRPRPGAAGPAASDAPPGPLDWLGKLFQPQPQNSPQNP